jgi:hypothetical protein
LKAFVHFSFFQIVTVAVVELAADLIRPSSFWNEIAINIDRCSILVFACQ